MKISLIAAMSKNRAIGKNNSLPWNMPADMQYFKTKTQNKPCIMGRKNFESMKKPLPGRPNIVISRNPNYTVPEGVHLVTSLEKALDLAKTLVGSKQEEIFIIGGQEIYTLSLPYANRIYLTLIDTIIEDADTFFPEFDTKLFHLISEDPHPADEKNPYPYNFQIYERISG